MENDELSTNFRYIVFEVVHASNRIDVRKFSSLYFFDTILAYSCRRMFVKSVMKENREERKREGDTKQEEEEAR